MQPHNHNQPASELASFISSRCPRCRCGQVFSNGAYALKTQGMNGHCPTCGFRFEREPGYFYIAMFVSYAMNVVEIIGIALACNLAGLSLEYENLWKYISFIFAGVVLLSPLNFRYSRLIVLYWLSPGVYYDPDWRRRRKHD